MGNVIHRNSTRLKVRRLNNGFTNANNFSEVFEIKKDEFNRWIGTDNNGKSYAFFIQHLRNENFFEIVEQN